MTFQVVEKDMELGEARMVLRCQECDEQIVVWGTFDEEGSIADDAWDAHSCPPRCVHCDEPMSFGDALSDEPNAIPVHRQCFEDDRPGVRTSIMAYLDAQDRKHQTVSA